MWELEQIGVFCAHGSADAASPVLECTVDGEAADTSPSYIQLSTYGGLAAGSEMDIPLTWRMASDGAHVLSCGIIDLSGTPLEAVEDLVTGDTGVTGAEVSWTYAEEVEETPMVTIVIALFVFLLGVAGIARVAAARTEENEEALDEASEALSDEPDPDLRAERQRRVRLGWKFPKASRRLPLHPSGPASPARCASSSAEREGNHPLHARGT